MRRVLLVTAVAMLVIPAGAARAASVYAPGDFIEFDAAPGERNDVTVTQRLSAPDQIVATIHDAGAPLTPVTGCVPLGLHTLACTTGAAPGNLFDVKLDDLDDSIRFVGVTHQAIIDGAAGNDTIAAPNYGSWLYGGPGDDTLTGSQAGDVLHGQGGNDRITPGLGPDTVTVGAGSSSVDVRDGAADSVECTDGGTATVFTDPFDTVTAC